MKYLSESNIENKRVLLRCDFNVPIKDGKILDDNKIKYSLDTIKLLLNNNCKVIILSHFGRVKEESDKINNTLYPVYEYLQNYLDIDFVKNPLDLSSINNSGNLCFLVENTRFTDIPEKKESANDLSLAKYWSDFADIFVLDAFASSHREHSSTAGISSYLPTYLGLNLERELNNLEILINNTKHPFTVIMGGAKVDDKIKIIKDILNKCDSLVLTGGILNTFLYVLGYNVGKSLISSDNDVLMDVKEILINSKDKISYSTNFVTNNGQKGITEITDEDIIYDNIIDIDFNESALIFVNGTCGKYEEDEYSNGTKNLLNNLSNLSIPVIIGGGDSVSAVKHFNLDNEFTYLSSGGGATLEYVSTGHLKALDYIEKCQK